MSLNLEKTVKDWIDTDPNGDGLTAYLEVPADRPKRFVTIERVGGSENEYSSHPTLAIQVWAETRWQAAQLATGTLLPRLLDLDLLDPIAAVGVESITTISFSYRRSITSFNHSRRKTPSSGSKNAQENMPSETSLILAFLKYARSCSRISG